MPSEKIYTIGKVSTKRPKMFTPEISISSETLRIDDKYNGYFLGGYKIYCDGSYLASIPAGSTVIDLGSFEYPSVSSYTITIRAFADLFNDSNLSNEQIFKMKGYNANINEFEGITATVTANYSLTINPKKKSALVCNLL